MNKKLVVPTVLGVAVIAIAVGLFLFFPNKSYDLANYQNITIGVDAPYPPYEFFDGNGELTGFEIELGNKLCDYLNINCTWKVTAWDTIIPDLNSGQFDMIMSSMSIETDRKKVVSFSDPYYNTPSVFFARKSKAIGGHSKQQLKGKTIAVQRGTLQEKYLTENYDDDVKVLALDGWDDVSSAFRASEADVIFTDYPQFEEEFFLERVYEILGDPVNLGDGVGLAFRKDDDELRKGMNAALKAIKKNGEYQRIRREYFFYDIMVN